MSRGPIRALPPLRAYLRPLLAPNWAQRTPVRGLAVLESELEQLDPVLRNWAGTVAEVLGDALPVPSGRCWFLC